MNKISVFFVVSAVAICIGQANAMMNPRDNNDKPQEPRWVPVRIKLHNRTTEDIFIQRCRSSGISVADRERLRSGCSCTKDAQYKENSRPHSLYITFGGPFGDFINFTPEPQEIDLFSTYNKSNILSREDAIPEGDPRLLIMLRGPEVMPVKAQYKNIASHFRFDMDNLLSEKNRELTLTLARFTDYVLRLPTTERGDVPGFHSLTRSTIEAFEERVADLYSAFLCFEEPGSIMAPGKIEKRIEGVNASLAPLVKEFKIKYNLKDSADFNELFTISVAIIANEKAPRYNPFEIEY